MFHPRTAGEIELARRRCCRTAFPACWTVARYGAVCVTCLAGPFSGA